MTNWKPDIREPAGPKYLALVDALETDIATGRLKPGERLPPQRELAESLGITIATITKAIGEATRRGLVTARTGSGTFIRGLEPDGNGERGVIDLSINAVPAGPVKPVLDRMLERLAARRASENLFAYQPSAGSERHRAAGARWIAARGLEAAPSRVLLSHGAQHALLAALVALTRPGDTVVCERLTYTGIRRLAELIQVRMTATDIDSEGLVPDALERTLRDSGAKVVICTPVTQNPTVACMPASRRRKIASICSKFDAFLIEDDIYASLAGDREPPIASFAPDRTVHITSFSKCVAPGFRLGYAAVPERLVNVMSDALVAAQWTAPSLYGELAALMIESGAANECVSAQQAEARRRLGIAHEHLGGSFREEHLTFHLWIEVPSERRPDDLVNELFQRGVRVSPASHFAIDDSALPNAIRVSLGSCTEDAALRDGLAMIGRTLRQRPQFSGTII